MPITSSGTSPVVHEMTPSRSKQPANLLQPIPSEMTRFANPPDDTTPLLRPARSCQGCTACCMWLPIPAGYVSQTEKPAKVACPWLKKGGCRIYPRRPSICQQFACTWLKQIDWPADWRPDHSGLLCLTEHIVSGISGSAVYEMMPGRLTTPLGQAIVSAVGRLSHFVTCITADGRRYNHPVEYRPPVPTRGVTEPHFVHIARKTAPKWVPISDQRTR